MSKTVWTARTDSDFVKIGKHSDALIDERHPGGHWQGVTTQGRVTVTDHNRELPKWLRTKIAREFIAIGLVCSVIAAGLFYFYA